MGADQGIDWRAAATSALDWWREAGVDILVDEVPRDWLAAPAPSPAAVPAMPGEAMPADLDAFVAWRGGEHVPEAAWPGRRLAAEGRADAALAVVIDGPTREDLAEGRLLSGGAGVLLDRMLAAIGLSRDDACLLPVATGRAIGGRVDRAAAARLGEIARHHLHLLRPPRVLLLGDAASRAVLGMECTRARGNSHIVNHAGGQSPAIVSLHPRYLLDRPAAKAEAWADLRLLIRTPATAREGD